MQQNPLSYFSKSEIKLLRSKGLEALRLELISKFRKTSGRTIKLNKAHFTEAEVEDLFVELRADLPNYILRLKYPEFDKFLAGDGIELLSNEKKADEIWEIIKKDENLLSLTKDRLRDYLKQYTQDFLNPNMEVVSAILDFTRRFPEKDLVYILDDSHKRALNVLMELQNAMRDPFYLSTGLELKIEIENYVKVDVFNLLNRLDFGTQLLSERYWVTLQTLVKVALQRESNFNKYFDEALQVLMEATIIGYRIKDTYAQHDILTPIIKAREAKVSGSSGVSSSSGVWTAIKIIIGLITLFISLSRM